MATRLTKSRTNWQPSNGALASLHWTSRIHGLSDPSRCADGGRYTFELRLI
ncbi:hypothetical protein G6514_002566 [Epicoccum nigrum]|nr:hypothetical protein G6514_002566 [Epicoccum nigrum]